MAKQESIRLFKEPVSFHPHVIEIKSITAANDDTILIDKKFLKNKLYSGTYILIRVVSGQVRVVTKNKVKELKQGDIILNQTKNITEIFSANAIFRIFIFNCTKQPINFKLDAQYAIAFDECEDRILNVIFGYDADDKNINAIINHQFASLYLTLIENYKHKAKNINPYSKEVASAVKYINENLNEKISFTDISKKYNLSERTFRKAFNSVMGVSPKTYQQSARMNIAATKLKDGDLTISEISDELGFYSQFHFSKDFKKHFGVTPSEYKKHCN